MQLAGNRRDALTVLKQRGTVEFSVETGANGLQVLKQACAFLDDELFEVGAGLEMLDALRSLQVRWDVFLLMTLEGVF